MRVCRVKLGTTGVIELGLGCEPGIRKCNGGEKGCGWVKEDEG